MLSHVATSIGSALPGIRGSGFADESAALFSRMPTQPSEARAAFIDGAFVRPMKAMGLYAGLKAFWPFIIAPTQADALIDWGPAANDAAIVGSMTFTAGAGFQRVTGTSYVGNNFGNVTVGSFSYGGFWTGGAVEHSIRDFNDVAGVGRASTTDTVAAQNNWSTPYDPESQVVNTIGRTAATPIMRTVTRFSTAQADVAYMARGILIGSDIGTTPSATVPSGLQTIPSMNTSKVVGLMMCGPGMTNAQLANFNSLVENLVRNIPA